MNFSIPLFFFIGNVYLQEEKKQREGAKVIE